MEHPDVMKQLQQEYIQAGSDIIYAPTFSGNRIKMKEYGLADRLEAVSYTHLWVMNCVFLWGEREWRKMWGKMKIL